MIEGELVKQINRLKRQLDDVELPEVSIDLVSPFLALPMLRGLWVASVNNAGNWYDLSGLSKTLTYNGNPTFNYSGLVPYWDYDGTEDYHSRADEADLDIIGTESYVAGAAQGLTMGGWFWLDALVSDRGFMSKWNSGTNNRSFLLCYDFGGTQTRFLISQDGTVGTRSEANSGGVDLSTGVWLFLAGRFDPSTEVKLWVNSTTYTTTAGVQPSIFNSNAAFEIGSFNAGTNNLDGRAALCFLCAAACSDAQLSSVFQQTRGAFGV